MHYLTWILNSLAIEYPIRKHDMSEEGVPHQWPLDFYRVQTIASSDSSPFIISSFVISLYNLCQFIKILL